MIFSIFNMIGPRGAEANILVPTSRGTLRSIWVRAVPLPMPTTLFERIVGAWAILTGNAHPVKWPEAGDLERALIGGEGT